MIRTRQKNIRLSRKEEQLLREKCFDLGIKESDYFRSVIYDYMPNNKLNDSINNLVYEIRKIGTNINQIAKVANQTGNINSVYLEHYKKELDKLIIEIRDRVLEINKIGK